jgi:hypothetical protein
MNKPEKSATPQPHDFSRLAQELIGDLRGMAFREPARMRRRATRDMAPLMDELLSKHQIGQSSLEDGIREQWAGIVGPANAQYSHPFKVDEKNVLHIVYAHAMVHSNLQLQRASILAKIKALPRCSMIRELRFRLGGG